MDYKQNIEDILDQALQEIASGACVQAITAKYPEQEKELRELFDITAIAYSLPKNQVPMARRRKLFRQHIRTPFWQRVNAVLRITTMPALALAVVFLTVLTAQGMENSLPGEQMYRMKRASEKLRLALTADPNAKANLELDYTQKRLAEAEIVIQRQADPAQQVAALNELQEQSKKSFALVPPVATTDAITKKDDSLLKKIIAVNNQQKDLLEKVEPQQEVSAIASNALKTTEDNQKTLASLYATVHDQTLADLGSEKIAITGLVDAVDLTRNKITVEKNSFTIDHTTTIKSGDTDIQISALSAKARVAIVGSKNNNIILAEKIELLEQPTVPTAVEKQPEVKGTTTKTPIDSNNSIPVQKDSAPVEPNPAEPAPTGTTQSSDPNKATGGYFLE